MTEERKHAILFVATILSARKLIDCIESDKPNFTKDYWVDKAINEPGYVLSADNLSMTRTARRSSDGPETAQLCRIFSCNKGSRGLALLQAAHLLPIFNQGDHLRHAASPWEEFRGRVSKMYCGRKSCGHGAIR